MVYTGRCKRHRVNLKYVDFREHLVVRGATKNRSKSRVFLWDLRYFIVVDITFLIVFFCYYRSILTKIRLEDIHDTWVNITCSKGDL